MECRVLSCGGAKVRHAKTRKSHHLVGFCVATFGPARQRYDKQEAKRRRMKSVELSCGGAKGRHAKTRKSPFGGFSRGVFSPFRPENTIKRNGTNQPPYVTRHKQGVKKEVQCYTIYLQTNISLYNSNLKCHDIHIVDVNIIISTL